MSEPVDRATRENVHRAVDAWLDRCGELPVKWDDGRWHTLQLTAAIAAYSDDDVALWSVTAERREQEDL